MIISIIDYGSGNVRSVAKAFERAISEASLGASVKITNDPGQVATSDRLVLPGVGAFADCKKGLESIPGMMDALETAVCSVGRPYFGICVGMQLMAQLGLEHGATRGFGWLNAEVRALAPEDKSLKIPHIGWNDIMVSEPRHPVFADLESGEHAYFVHSYHIICDHRADVLAHTDYGDQIIAAVGKDNIFGTQFHPEKSQKVGLKIITNFLSWRP